MKGTPPVAVTFSRSISRNASTHQRGAARGDVEQRDHHQDGARLRRGRHLAPAQRGLRAAEGAGQDIGGKIAVRAQRALRASGGSAGVEDRGGIVRNDSGVRQGTVGKRRIAVRVADHVLQQTGAFRCCGVLVRAAHQHMRQPRQLRAMGNDALPPVGIGDQDMCATIRQSEGQFVALPPGVERHRDRAENRGGEQGDRPFGQIAHGNRHAVPLAHAQFRQMGG